MTLVSTDENGFATYAAVNVAYGLRLIRIVLLDVFLITSGFGFGMRIQAGTICVGIASSRPGSQLAVSPSPRSTAFTNGVPSRTEPVTRR